MIIDVRDETTTQVTEIQFSDNFDFTGEPQAFKLVRKEGSSYGKYLLISDDHDLLVVTTRQHALDLITALQKAIELEWVK